MKKKIKKNKSHPIFKNNFHKCPNFKERIISLKCLQNLIFMVIMRKKRHGNTIKSYKSKRTLKINRKSMIDWVKCNKFKRNQKNQVILSIIKRTDNKEAVISKTRRKIKAKIEIFDLIVF